MFTDHAHKFPETALLGAETLGKTIPPVDALPGGPTRQLHGQGTGFAVREARRELFGGGSRNVGMNLTLRFYATFREAVGQKEIQRSFAPGMTVGDVLETLSEDHPELEFFEETGELRSYLSILKNGRDITFLDGPDTDLDDGDTLSIFPPVAGGDDRSLA